MRPTTTTRSSSNRGRPASINWRDDHSPWLKGHHVVVLADNDDDAGRRHGQKVATSVDPHAASLKVVELPDLPPKGDIIDWLESGRTIEDMVTIAAATSPWSPSSTDRNGKPQLGIVTPPDDEGDYENTIIDRRPTIDPAAFHGIAGEIVWKADPHTEADPAAVLVQFLIGFANALGRGPETLSGKFMPFD